MLQKNPKRAVSREKRFLEMGGRASREMRVQVQVQVGEHSLEKKLVEVEARASGSLFHACEQLDGIHDAAATTRKHSRRRKKLGGVSSTTRVDVLTLRKVKKRLFVVPYLPMPSAMPVPSPPLPSTLFDTTLPPFPPDHSNPPTGPHPPRCADEDRLQIHKKEGDGGDAITAAQQAVDASKSTSPSKRQTSEDQSLLPAERAALSEAGLAARRLAQDLRAAGANDDGLRVRENGRDGVAAGALDVHEEGARRRHERLHFE